MMMMMNVLSVHVNVRTRRGVVGGRRRRVRGARRVRRQRDHLPAAARTRRLRARPYGSGAQCARTYRDLYTGMVFKTVYDTMKINETLMDLSDMDNYSDMFFGDPDIRNRYTIWSLYKLTFTVKILLMEEYLSLTSKEDIRKNLKLVIFLF